MTAPAPGIAAEHRTVSRVTTILERVAVSPDGLTLSQLVEALSAPKSSVHSLAKGLVATGYLREEDGRYLTGPAVGALLATGPSSIVPAALPVMDRLRQEVDETVMLGTMVGRSVVYVAAVESTQRIRYSPPLHERRPLYPTSTGKCFLAHMSERRRLSYLEASFPPSRRAEIEAELGRVRAEGVAFNRGETLPDISAAASPVLVCGRVVACLALAGPTHRFADLLTEVAAREVLGAAETVAARVRGG